MPAVAVYADATALIGLGRINRLDLFTLLPTPVYVTDYVWREVASDPEKPGARALQQARDEGLLAVVEEGSFTAFPQLDPGECTVLTAAMVARAAVIIDERKARALIESDPELKAAIRGSTGIIGLLLLAKRQGRILAVRPLIEELIRQDFWISPAFYRDVLHQAGEL